MNVRKYSLALIVGSFVSTMALAQAPAATAQEKNVVTQSKTEKQKDVVNGSATTPATTEKSAESKSVSATHDGKHVAKASKEESKSTVTKKEEPAKAAEKSSDMKSNTTQSPAK
jgi:hypothetical protein